ncbi:histone-fold-containing protein [Metschnikowia bicuspidata var. bicuspidata NRRL YB-4993]|uniref:Histone-fold-containing protein n=1 Tax=Metschnikowia bicuspidata var. bicuspidata NRRL YB-4993 TaxID=869754 RepID=A0A1A0HED5_9ASCO|nr:histone-fold-containing protein [Metschnikowia bicuspidata var. bicuspidata NRRL YB-4993]OBA22474.1 histone-fold-containing protein [Metschnikowia bicuspidata var. bicuspidata NRRL YB-4993]
MSAANTTSENIEPVALEEETAMSLPLSKIKKIFKMDPEFAGASASAVYATGAATELFVQYLVEQASMNAKSEKRKKIQYRDLSATVSSQESLHFLSDTIPKTQTVEKALKEKRINISEEDRKTYSSLLEENGAVADNDTKLLAGSAAESEKMKPALDKGQATLPFQSMANANVKKAGLLDLIAADDNAPGDSDAMVIDE